jgi:muramidase (phage lysozyme)
MADGSTQTVTGFNPYDPVQIGFLAALANGETGGATNALYTGVGGSDLSGLPTDQYGFPQWQGLGNSHAAGIFQFQPGTWDETASTYGLNFANPQDQSAGAWYVASDAYAKATGGGSLEDALQSGQYDQVQQALGGTWPSVFGNANLPQGLSGALPTTIAQASDAVASAGSGSSAATAQQTGFRIPFISDAIDNVEKFFVRGGLVLLGLIIIAIALWILLSKTTPLPGPGDVAKAAAAAL